MEILSNLLHITQPMYEMYSEDSILGPLILRTWGVSYTYVSVCVCVCVCVCMCVCISSQRVFDIRSERESVMGS